MFADPVYLVTAIIAVTLSGLAKGGFSGVGVLSVPIMALSVDPVRAAAILLPILILQDAVSIWAYRKSWDRHILKVMLPGMTAGIIIGYLFAAQVHSTAILGLLGGIVILFGLQQLWKERGGAIVLPSTSPDWVGTLFGLVSGFTSQIGHAGAPPFQMWVLPKRLPRDIFVGTSALAFGAMNWMKVPTYAALGQFTRANLLATAMLVPVAFIATLAGVALVRRVDPQRFYHLIYVMMILVGIKLIADALMA